MSYVGALVEVYTLVTLTGTKQVAGYGVSSNLSQCTRHAQRTTCHSDVCSSCDIRHLVTAIDVRQDMSATDVHIRVALYQTCRRQPLIDTCCCGLIGEVARATAKDIAIERMTVIARSAGCAISFCLIMAIVRILIVWQPWASVCPVSTLSHSACFCNNLLCGSRRRVNEVFLSISSCPTSTKTNLTALDVNASIV